MKDKTFVKITNQDVYKLLLVVDKKVSKINGIVKWHTIAISALFAIILSLIGFVVYTH